jgi:organic hydroperoxide reductase OsmC/OhrA
MEEYFYEVSLTWESEKNGLLNSHNLREIEVVNPESPKDIRDKWTSEHLLAASLSSSFMNVFLDIAASSKLELVSYRSECFIKLEKVGGKYITTEILLRPTIKLISDLYMSRASKLLEEAENTCPVRNTLSINISIHPKFEYLNKGKQERVKSK